jgi:hypothetical protein
VATGLIRASLIGDKFAPDTILTRAVEADLDGLFFAFTMANLAGRVLAYARTSEAQVVALLDNLINGLVRERARAAALQLKLDFVPGFGLLPRLGLGLSFQPHPRGVFIAGLPFGLLRRGTPRCPVILPGFILRARPRLPFGSGLRVHVGDALVWVYNVLWGRRSTRRGYRARRSGC